MPPVEKYYVPQILVAAPPRKVLQPLEVGKGHQHWHVLHHSGTGYHTDKLREVEPIVATEPQPELVYLYVALEQWSVACDL